MSLSTFILAELYRGGAAYGLELARRFEKAGIASWERVNHGSVYRALGKLREGGLVARFAEGRRRRNRKFYMITARGRRHFELALSDELVRPRTYRNPLDVAVACLRVIPPARAVSLLEERRRSLAGHEELASSVAAKDAGADRRATYGRLAAERILMKTRAELFFAASLADYLRASG